MGWSASGGSGGGGISNVVEDTTPQLGGDLDMNSQNITAAGPTTISPTEMSYLDGVTSNLQTQIDGITGATVLGILAIHPSEVVTTGDGKSYAPVPTEYNGLDINAVRAIVTTASTSGTPTVQIARGRQASAGAAHTWVDVLSTLLTVDANEYNSGDAATAAVINAANDDVATGDLLRIDVDVAGTGTQGLLVLISFG